MFIIVLFTIGKIWKQQVPINSIEGSFLSTSSPTLVIYVLFDDSHSDRCEMISYCGFGLHFFDDYLLMVSMLPCACWTSFSLLWKKCIFRSSAQFLNWFIYLFIALSYMSCLYTLDINPL